MIQRTLILIKPDAVRKNLTDEIIRRYEAAGLKVVKRKDLVAPLDIIEKHYPMDPDYLKSIGEKTIAAGQQVKSAEDQGRKVVTWLRQFITSGSIVAMVLEGENAVEVTRNVTGFTDPSQAKKGTIRGDLGTDNILDANREGRPVYNLIHASGSPAEAKKEIKLWFGASIEDEVPNERLKKIFLQADKDLKAGKASPTFRTGEEAVAWLEKQGI